MAQEISIFSIFSEIKLRESFLLFDDLMAQRFNKPLLTTSQRAELKASIDELREKKNVFQAYYNQHREFIAKQALIEVLTDPALKQFNSVTSGIKREYNGFTIYFNVEYFENRKRSVPSRDYDITTMVKHESRLSFFLFDVLLLSYYILPLHYTMKNSRLGLFFVHSAHLCHVYKLNPHRNSKCCFVSCPSHTIIVAHLFRIPGECFRH